MPSPARHDQRAVLLVDLQVGVGVDQGRDVAAGHRIAPRWGVIACLPVVSGRAVLARKIAPGRDFGRRDWIVGSSLPPGRAKPRALAGRAAMRRRATSLTRPQSLLPCGLGRDGPQDHVSLGAYTALRATGSRQGRGRLRMHKREAARAARACAERQFSTIRTRPGLFMTGLVLWVRVTRFVVAPGLHRRTRNDRLHPPPPAAGRAGHAGGGASSPSRCSPMSATRSRSCSARTTAEAQRTRLMHELGLDQPFFVQFATFVGNAVQGEFRHLLPPGAPGRRADRWSALPATLELGFAAAVLALVVGMPMGVYTGLHRNSWLQPRLPDRLAGRRVAADLPDRHPADPDLLRLARLAAVASGAATSVQLGWWTTGLPDRQRAEGADPAGDHARRCSS